MYQNDRLELDRALSLTRFRKWVRYVFVNILRRGLIPQHVAFVMDGNRRYARKHDQSTKEGHSAGFATMSQILDFGYWVGIKEVTVFAFSIENFYREQKEVDHLMDIARTRLMQLIDRGDLVDKYALKIRVVGDIRRLPADVQAVVQTIVGRSKHNTGAILNLCMPYTGRDDIAHAIESIVECAVRKTIDPKDISEEMITRHLYTQGSLPLDLLVRTSGVQRLSDFLLWEINELPKPSMGSLHGTYIEFTPTLWPEYTPYQFFKSLLRWSYAETCRRWSTEIDT